MGYEELNMMRNKKGVFFMQQHESFIDHFFLHLGHIVLLSAHVQNTTIVSFCLFLFTLMGILIKKFMSNITPQIFYR